MHDFPNNLKTIKARASKFKSVINKESKDNDGYFRDRDGKRYLITMLLFAAGDMSKMNGHIKWFNKECPDDTGEPCHNLCIALARNRSGEPDAEYLLAKCMLSNIYLIPYVLGRKPMVRLDMWHGSNYADVDYFEYVYDELFEYLNTKDREWLEHTYDSDIFVGIRNRHIDFRLELQNPSVGNERSAMDREFSNYEPNLENLLLR